MSNSRYKSRTAQQLIDLYDYPFAKTSPPAAEEYINISEEAEYSIEELRAARSLTEGDIEQIWTDHKNKKQQ